MGSRDTQHPWLLLTLDIYVLQAQDVPAVVDTPRLFCGEQPDSLPAFLLTPGWTLLEDVAGSGQSVDEEGDALRR